MAMLPASLTLKLATDGKYLRYCPERDQTYGRLRCTEDKLVEIAALFEVEKAKTWPGLVHIKSRYNNRYLVRWNPDDEYITASAHAPNENERNWACTLFQPLPVDNTNNNVRLVHVQLGNCVFIPNHSKLINDTCLVASADKHDDEQEVFTFVDWTLESPKLPKYVAFQSLDNNKYLGVSLDARSEKYLKFTFEDPYDNRKEVMQEIFPTPEGILYIKLDVCESSNGYWKTIKGDFVVAHADYPLSLGAKHTTAMFRLIELDNKDEYALQHMHTSYFCKRLENDCLGATAEIIDKSATFKMIDMGNQKVKTKADDKNLESDKEAKTKKGEKEKDSNPIDNHSD